jgi:hypothetical protein
MKNLSQKDARCLGRDSNFVPPAYKTETLPLELTCPVTFIGSNVPMPISGLKLPFNSTGFTDYLCEVKS